MDSAFGITHIEKAMPWNSAAKLTRQGMLGHNQGGQALMFHGMKVHEGAKPLNAAKLIRQGEPMGRKRKAAYHAGAKKGFLQAQAVKKSHEAFIDVEKAFGLGQAATGVVRRLGMSASKGKRAGAPGPGTASGKHAMKKPKLAQTVQSYTGMVGNTGKDFMASKPKTAAVVIGGGGALTGGVYANRKQGQ